MYLREPGLLPAVHRALQLLLVHARAALDAHPLGLVVELLLRPALRPVRARAQAAALAGRHVCPRELRGLLRLAGAGPLLVHGPRSDLLRPLLRRAALLETLLDVLVLPFPLVAPGLLRHGDPPFRFQRRSARRGRGSFLVDRLVLDVV